MSNHVPMPYTEDELETASRVLMGKIYSMGFGPDACRDITREMLDSFLGETYQAPEPEPAPERHNLIGFQIIGEMSREDLINECLAFHRAHCETVSNRELKAAIVNSRVTRFQQRLITEADLDEGGGSIFSWLNR